MRYIVLGALAFLLVHLIDVVSLFFKRASRLKLYVWVLASGLLIYAVTGTSLHPGKFSLPAWTSWLGWALFLPALLLFLYSLFVNLPFRKTYLDTKSEQLIKVSLYALVRHPGVYFSFLTLISLILVSHSRLLLTATLLWEGLDLLLIFVDDYYTFSRMFPGYDDYRRETPLLIPSRKSLRSFLDSTGKR
ncbi:MAG: hypothetical protein V1894_05200 [Chloroflexota bacterium]